MNSFNLGIILLILLAGIIVLAPIGNASQIPPSDEAILKPLNLIAINESQIPPPLLIFNKTVKPIRVNSELRVQTLDIENPLTTLASSENPIIPEGAIIYHSNDGLTTIFDSKGQQLFAAEDAQSSLINTPDGAWPATYIVEIPEKSLIDDNNNSIKVYYNNQRILTGIDNSSAFTPSVISRPQVSTTQQYPIKLSQWIEWTQTSIIPNEPITSFSADFNVPKKPVNSDYTNNMRGSVSTIWSGLETEPAPHYLLQPVPECI